jgi:hypothetical protein
MRDFRLSKNFKIVLNDTADLEQTELHSNSFQLLKIAAMLRLAASEVADCGGIEEQLPMLCQCCANACSVCAGALCVCVPRHVQVTAMSLFCLVQICINVEYQWLSNSIHCCPKAKKKTSSTDKIFRI